MTRCAVVVPPAPLIAEGLDYWAGMGEEERRSWMRVTQGGEPQQAEAQETWEWVRSGMPGLDDLEEEDLAMFTAAMREAFLQGPAGHLDDGTSLSRDWGFRVEDGWCGACPWPSWCASRADIWVLATNPRCS